MKITAIDEVTTEVTTEVKVPGYGYNEKYEGYAITLDDGSAVQMLIHSEQQCCENYGYLMSNDNLSEFIGADLLDVKTVDTTAKAGGDHPYDADNNELCTVFVNIETGRRTVFVNIETSRGTLQFTAYNEHNGYYGHAVLVTWGDKTIESVTI